MKEPFKSYSKYVRETFGERVQKVSVDAGFTCPNRDGTTGRGGCTYCNNDTFNPLYTSAKKSIKTQIEEGIAFFEPKYKTQKYLAYFQAYTNTYDNAERLKKMYDDALSLEKVIGLVVSTRPDAINKENVDLLSKYAEKYYVSVELGIESTKNESLEKINRCHSFKDTINAYNLLKNKGIKLGGHLILGLPDENRIDFENHAKKISNLGLDFLKLHQLQIIKGTKMAKEYLADESKFKLFSVDEYVEEVVNFIRHTNKNIIFERFSSESPMDLLIAPKWGGLKNFEITDKIRNYMIKNNFEQGDKL